MDRKIGLLWVLPLLLFPVVFAGTVAAQTFKTEQGFVEFTSEVPLHTFTGTSEHLVGKINLSDSVVDFYVDLNTLDTGNGKRDKDMRETLETDKYPFAEFYGTLVSSFNPDTAIAQQAKVRGDFSVHGVTRNVTIEGTLQKTDRGLEVKATWTLNLKDYNVKPPGILFYRVDEKIDITINAVLKPVSQ